MATVEEAIAEILDSEGFTALAQDARAGNDTKQYARIAYRNAPESYKQAIGERLLALGFRVTNPGYRG